MRGRKVSTINGVIYRIECEITRLLEVMHPIWKYGTAYEHQKSWKSNSILAIHNIVGDLAEMSMQFPDEAIATFIARQHDMLCGLIEKERNHNMVTQMLVILLDAREQLLELEESEKNDENRN